MPNGPLDIEQLLQDDSFIRWVLREDQEDQVVWEEHLRRWPEQEALIQRARRELVLLAAGLGELAKEEDWRTLQEKMSGKRAEMRPDRGPRIHRRWTLAAAVFLAILGTGAWWIYFRSSDRVSTGSVEQARPADIAPGGNKATLTLGDGQKIILDSAANGRIAEQGNSSIDKPSGGQLVYEQKNNLRSGTESMLAQKNTLSTPRGGQYRLLLPDGSRVWLNAASSLTYPTAFSGRERKVEVSGEAYFEIAADPSRPFTVRIHHPDAGDGEIAVLGTRFDIQAYADEPETRATLVDGAVRYSRGGDALVLHPGEQVRQSNRNDATAIRLVRGVDTDAAIAWTTGFFPFEELDLSAVLRQISRWYDVDIDDRASEATHRRRFGGRISRQLSLLNALHLLESNNIHFRLEGRTLIVLP